MRNDMKKPIALSHSRLNDYNMCPLRFKAKYLDKDPRFKEDGKKSPHLIRGENVHKALENYVIQVTSGQEPKITSLPEVEATKPYIDKIISRYRVVLPESQIAVNEKWERVEWFSSEAYYRAIFDLIALNDDQFLIVDYKTGKMRDYNGGPTGKGQLHLSAAIALHMWPTIESGKTVYAYVDHKQTIIRDFAQSEKAELTSHFDAEYAKVNADKDFKPTPNEFCKYCPLTRKECPYSRKL